MKPFKVVAPYGPVGVSHAAEAAPYNPIPRDPIAGPCEGFHEAV